MATRSNFYKNPSYAYNKDFNLNSALQNLQGFISYLISRVLYFLQFNSFFPPSFPAYNVVTGNIPPPVESNSVEEKTVHRKLRRERKSKVHQHKEVEDNDVPLSHLDYIKKRR